MSKIRWDLIATYVIGVGLTLALFVLLLYAFFVWTIGRFMSQ